MSTQLLWVGTGSLRTGPLVDGLVPCATRNWTCRGLSAFGNFLGLRGRPRNPSLSTHNSIYTPTNASHGSGWYPLFVREIKPSSLWSHAIHFGTMCSSECNWSLMVTPPRVDLGRLCQEPVVASLLLVAMPGAPSSFLLLVVWPGAPCSVLAPSSDARSSYSSFLLLVVRP